MGNRIKNITAEEFDKLNFDDFTLVDLREPDELIVSSIPGSINLPFSKFAAGLNDIPKEKPVIVYCSTGYWSREVADILVDRGYDVYNLEGGYDAYRKFKGNGSEDSLAETTEASENKAYDVKQAKFVDAKGLKCPGPIVAVGDAVRSINGGQRVYVEATEEAFKSDIKVWCRQTGNELLKLTNKDGVISALIEKHVEKINEKKAENDTSSRHEKTMVIFSDNLDKTIAAFIMANGAAAMGRPVTMFFTFWGLNILRKPKKVKVKKDIIGKMFGTMMPRGTKKLGLSQMNMGGLGAKMIRALMKKNGIKSLEELIQDALDHNVKIYACQMSMDIMGIKMEELIDGIEPVGVATMLGAAENSDMTYFI